MVKRGNKEAVEKRKRTCLLRYGTESTLQNLEIKSRIRDTNIRKYGVECWNSSEEGKKQLSKSTKEHWDRIKEELEELECYSFEETRSILEKHEYWKKLKGKAKNRTLLRENPKLFKSIYRYSESLEQKMRESGRYSSAYNFSHRVMFLIEKDGDIDKMKCSCGRRYSWTGGCKYCSEKKDTYKNLTPEQRQLRSDKQSKASRIRVAKKLIKKGCGPAHDLESIPILERFAKDRGLNLRHAENGGEEFVHTLGYWLDGYDKDRGVAVEIDEPFHFRLEGELSDKERKRQKDIEVELGCTFYRLYFNKKTERVILYNSPDTPNNWNFNRGIELTEVETVMKNGRRKYSSYSES